jgi:hypothetical protein
MSAEVIVLVVLAAVAGPGWALWWAERDRRLHLEGARRYVVPPARRIPPSNLEARGNEELAKIAGEKKSQVETAERKLRTLADSSGKVYADEEAREEAKRLLGWYNAAREG